MTDINDKKIIFPYVRFSTDEQKKGQSFNRQTERIIKYASENNFSIDNTLKLNDLGKSAFHAEHIKSGSLGRFLAAIEQNLIPTDGTAYLCIEQLDRLSRQNIDEASELFRKILRKNVNIITLMDYKIYTKGSLRNFMDIVYSLLLMDQANLESEKKSERILDVFNSRVRKIDQGEKVQFAGMLPGWIDNLGTKYNTNFVLNEKAEIIKDIFDKYSNGYSLSEITRYLDNENIPPIARKRHKNFTNRWSSGRVSHILSNRCVIGELRVKRINKIYENYYPSVISKEEFLLVEEMRIKKKISKSSGRKSINIFTGKIFCGECGQKVYFETDDKTIKGTKYLYHCLKCSARRYQGCDNPTLRYDDFLQSDPEFFDLKKNQNNKYTAELIKKIESEIIEYRRRKRRIENSLKELEEKFENGNYDTELFLKTGTRFKQNIEIIELDITDKIHQLKTESNINKMNGFDKNNPEDIFRAKNIIDQIYTAFIILPKCGICFKLYKNGFVNIFKLIGFEDNFGNIEQDKKLIKFFRNIKKAKKENKLDGKFEGILNAMDFWNKESELTDRKLIEEISFSDPVDQVYEESHLVSRVILEDYDNVF